MWVFGSSSGHMGGHNQTESILEPVMVNHPLLVNNVRKVATGHEFSVFLTREYFFQILTVSG